MTQTLATLIRRDDTFFGVCQAIGDDFGFNANWLRVALALPVIFNPLLSLAAYGVLALAVIAARLLVPAAPRRATGIKTVAAPAAHGEAANDAVELAQAA